MADAPEAAVFPWRRLLAGLAAGVVAAVVFVLVLASTGADAIIVERTPLTSVSEVVALQMLLSIAVGGLFAAQPGAGGWGRGLGWGLAYGAVVWLLLDLVAFRAWSGLPVAFTSGAWLGLLGRLVWGAAMGLSFVALMLATFRPVPGRPAA